MKRRQSPRNLHLRYDFQLQTFLFVRGNCDPSRVTGTDGSTRNSFTRNPHGAQQQHTQFRRNRGRRRSAPPYLTGVKSVVISFSIAAHRVSSLALRGSSTHGGGNSFQHATRTGQRAMLTVERILSPRPMHRNRMLFALSHAFSAVDRFSETETSQVSMLSLRRTTFPVALRGSGAEVIRHREGTLYFARRALTNVCNSASATDTGASTTTIAATSSP